MSVVAMPLPERIPCDRNGLPEGHSAAMEACLQEFMDHVNDLPESVYHLNRQDAQWVLDNVLARYLSKLVRVR